MNPTPSNTTSAPIPAPSMQPDADSDKSHTFSAIAPSGTPRTIPALLPSV
jgi:hypothetical protein